ncbi:hypothetical protein GA0074695_2935 [Micromonospora viridifaciens]|uniref:Uncharacterized protein n=2 Tax=Micromonospora viridifaciens TaxID=1881 RepID=A0A1C4X2T1_MICVI|nr:hypothetical protein GA0074695_2935 [Micromonospora viridifaciens]
MEVIIQVSMPSEPAAAADTAFSDVRAVLAGLGLPLEPLHPGSTDPTLSTYFHVWAADPETAHRVVSAVRDLPSVRTAYVKPPAAPA